MHKQGLPLDQITLWKGFQTKAVLSRQKPTTKEIYPQISPINITVNWILWFRWKDVESQIYAYKFQKFILNVLCHSWTM